MQDAHSERAKRPKPGSSPFIRRFTALCALLPAASSCSTPEPLRTEWRGSAELVAVGDSTIELEAELEVELRSGTPETVALDSICFELDYVMPAHTKSIEFEVSDIGDARSEWPVELSGDPNEVVKRRIRVKLSAELTELGSHPCAFDERQLRASVVLASSATEERPDGCKSGRLIEHTMSCPSCPRSLEALGLEAMWQESAFSTSEPGEVVAAPDGPVWAIMSDDEGFMRIARADGLPFGVDGWELEDVRLQGMNRYTLTTGLEPGVLYVEAPSEAQHPEVLAGIDPPIEGLGPWTVSAREPGWSRWSTELFGIQGGELGQIPVLSAGAGRVFARIQSPIGLVVDGQLVDEGSPTGLYAALLDERSGELVDHAWLEHPVLAARGLEDGGFIAVAAEASRPYSVLRIEADLSISWILPFADEIAPGYSEWAEPLTVDSEGFTYWRGPSDRIHRIDPHGVLVWSVPSPSFAETLVPAPQGGVLVGSRLDGSSRIDASGAIVVDGTATGPSWCPAPSRWFGEGGPSPAFVEYAYPTYTVGRAAVPPASR